MRRRVAGVGLAMLAVFLVTVMVTAADASARRSVSVAGHFDRGTCSFKGKKLYGRIQIVTAFPDVKIQEVKSFPDLKVQEVKGFADKCGQWMIVKAFPNTKIQLVSTLPDVKVQHVTAFPGVP